jgi:hypothetical protein
MVIWNILRPYGIIYGRLWSFGIFFLIWYVLTKKDLATLVPMLFASGLCSESRWVGKNLTPTYEWLFGYRYVAQDQVTARLYNVHAYVPRSLHNKFFEKLSKMKFSKLRKLVISISVDNMYV